jgi:hypothetical protein
VLHPFTWLSIIMIFLRFFRDISSVMPWRTTFKPLHIHLSTHPTDLPQYFDLLTRMLPTQRMQICYPVTKLCFLHYPALLPQAGTGDSPADFHDFSLARIMFTPLLTFGCSKPQQKCVYYPTTSTIIITYPKARPQFLIWTMERKNNWLM